MRLKPGRVDLKQSDRAAFVGQTGSGKTTLAKALLHGWRRVFVLDPKRTFNLPLAWPGGVAVVDGTDLAALRGAEVGTIIIRPGLSDIASKEASMQWADVWCWYAFNRGKTLVYVDEVMAVTTAQRAPAGFAACLQMGRERGVGTWTATQRPAFVPLIMLTESQHFFIFRLRHKDDRERMADYTDPAVKAPVQHANGFWYYADDSGARYYQRADVGSILPK